MLFSLIVSCSWNEYWRILLIIKLQPTAIQVRFQGLTTAAKVERNVLQRAKYTVRNISDAWPSEDHFIVINKKWDNSQFTFFVYY